MGLPAQVRLRSSRQQLAAANDPGELAKVLGKLGEIQAAFNKSAGADKEISLVDLIVLGRSHHHHHVPCADHRYKMMGPVELCAAEC